MAEEQKKPEITYDEDEIASIRDLVSFFNEAPGQVNAIDDSEEEEDIPIGGSATTPAESTGEDFSFDDDFQEPVTPAPSRQADTEDSIPDASDFSFGDDVSTPAISMDDDLSLGDDFSTPPADLSAPAEDFSFGDDFSTPPADLSAPADDFSFGDDFSTPPDDVSAPAEDLSFGDDFSTPPDDVSAPAEDFSFGDDFSNPPADVSAPAEDSSFGDDFSTPPDDLSAPADVSAGGSFSEPAFPEPLSLDDVNPDVVLKGAAPSIQDEFAELHKEYAGGSGSIFSDAEIQTFRTNAKRYSLPFRKALVDLLLRPDIMPGIREEIMRRVISGSGELALSEYIESETGEKISRELKGGPSKVIVTRPEYTDSGLARQQKILKLIRLGSIAALAVIIISAAAWLGVIKPMRYNNFIESGRNLILHATPDSKQKPEELFEKAVRLYPHKPDAFLRFADAYRKKGMYREAFVKLYGDIGLLSSPLRFQSREFTSADEIWNSFEKVPVAAYGPKNNILLLNGTAFSLKSKGAYLITHLDKKKNDGRVLMALAAFHSNHSRRFHDSPYRNNRLGIDYYQRILNFKTEFPFGKKARYLNDSVMGIGEIYFNQNNYTKALEYYERVVLANPRNPGGQSGILRSLIRISKTNNDPKLVIQTHSVIKHTLDMENSLPMHVMAELAAFYIDLPDENTLRIKYNLSPEDKVNSTQLRRRALELLTKIREKKETDAFGNVKNGKTYAEAYYQLGRYYRHVEKNHIMALKQFEYAFTYDKRHFMALNDRAELLLEINDYQGAAEHLKLAAPLISAEALSVLGDSPEDESLLRANRAKIPFNAGKAIFLNAVDSLGPTDDWIRMLETSRYSTPEQSGELAFLAALDQAEAHWAAADAMGTTDESLKAEMNYSRGWAAYARGDYRQALQFLESMPMEMQQKNPHIELARSNSWYRMALSDPANREKYLENALGILGYLESYYAEKAAALSDKSLGKPENMRLFSQLAIVHNNEGAMLELLGDEAESLAHYWKAVDFTNRINRENEISLVNMKLHFKRENLDEKERYPLIMDFFPPLLADS